MKLSKSMEIKECEKHGLAEHFILKREKYGRRDRLVCIKCYRNILYRHANNITEKRRNTKEEAVLYKGRVCLDCGKAYNVKVMDFHHRDQRLKDFAINDHIYSSLDLIKSELDKCDLLCPKCHRTRHCKEETALIYKADITRIKYKSILVKAFSSTCSCCRDDGPDYIFDFHHLDSKTKKFGISSALVRHKSWDAVIEEIAKCAMLCVTCHKLLHIGELAVTDAIAFDSKLANELKSNDINVRGVLVQNRQLQQSFCKTCNVPISYGSSHCKLHGSIESRKVPRPSLKELTDFLSMNSYLAAGRKYGVSDKAIRKWLKSKASI